MKKISSVVIILFVLVIAIVIFKSKQSPNEKSSLPPKEQNASGTVVHLATWSNMVAPAVLAEFEKTSGIKVRVSNYSSNEELLAKLQAGATGYDIIMPSDYMVLTMANLGLLHELKLEELPNFKDLDEKLVNKPFDPKNRFSVPYDWGTTGIAVNRSLYKGRLEGWQDLFETPELSGKFTLLDDVRETIGAALKCAGFSLNSNDAQSLDQAKKVLLKALPHVKAFTSEPLISLVNGDVIAAHAYLPDALQARKKTGGKIQFVIPKEGCTLWIDSLVIPNGATNIEGAHRLINFLLDAKTNITTVMNIFVGPANKNVIPLLPPELQNDPALLPPPEKLEHAEMINEIGEAITLWDRIWTEIKTTGH